MLGLGVPPIGRGHQHLQGTPSTPDYQAGVQQEALPPPHIYFRRSLSPKCCWVHYFWPTPRHVPKWGPRLPSPGSPGSPGTSPLPPLPIGVSRLRGSGPSIIPYLAPPGGGQGFRDPCVSRFQIPCPAQAFFPSFPTVAVVVVGNLATTRQTRSGQGEPLQPTRSNCWK